MHYSSRGVRAVRRVQYIALAFATVASQACVGDPYPGPLPHVESDSDTVCTDIDRSISQYRVDVDVGGADGNWTHGGIHVVLEKERSFRADRLRVALRCGDSEEVGMPSPDTGVPTTAVHSSFEGSVPFQASCHLTLEHPSVHDDGSCMPWFIRVDAGLGSRDARDAFVNVQVTEQDVPE